MVEQLMSANDDLERRVLLALEEVRPGLRRDGGDLSFVAIDEGVVRIRLLGACSECSLAPVTLLGFITERVRHHAPEITRVESV